MLLDKVAIALALLQEGQQSELTTPRVEQGLDLLERMVVAY